MFYRVSIISIIFRVCHSAERLPGLNSKDPYCRDNDNKPVDWWYLYNPPLGKFPNLNMSLNFSFITPDTTGKWVASNTSINSNSMLQHTLSPMYQATYYDSLAVLAYSDREKGIIFQGSAAYGLMMTDASGGILMGYTVPGLIKLKDLLPSFPKSELHNGHLIMCLSLDLSTLNLIAQSLREAAPVVSRLRVPQSLRRLLPDWHYFNRPTMQKMGEIQPLDFLTRSQNIHVMLLVRRPGDERCLYRSFAEVNSIILDVYGHNEPTHSFCEKSYGVRNIDSISLKYPDTINYIDNQTDRSCFAVSTAAHWQMVGDGRRQYWACTGSMGREDRRNGGILVCLEDYDIWWKFDNMKIKEPNC